MPKGAFGDLASAMGLNEDSDAIIQIGDVIKVI